MNDVVIGAWREGLNKTISQDIATIEKRYHQGFRQLPYESTVMELVLILDAQDLMFADLLVDMECECQCDHHITTQEEFDESIVKLDEWAKDVTPKAKKPKSH